MVTRLHQGLHTWLATNPASEIAAVDRELGFNEALQISANQLRSDT